MSTTRRDFLVSSLAAAAASFLALRGAAAKDGAQHGARSQPAAGGAAKAGKPKKILVLGGTRFLGPAVVDAARRRGHTLTLFNRNKSRPNRFADLELLLGDRDSKKKVRDPKSEKEYQGLEALAGRQWDAVVDTCGHFVRWVRESAELLAKNGASHYIYISSISAYADNEAEGQEEDAPVCKLKDESVESWGENYANYGGLKAACERTAEKAFPGRTTNIRPGFIVGPDDESDRFTYWPVRHDRGGEMLAPGSSSDPIQIIDVRDLGDWIVHVIETEAFGVFNACGPGKPWTMGAVIEASAKASGKDTKVTWVPADFLKSNGEEGDGNVPIWVPYEGKTKGFHKYSNARAVKAGLKFRDPVVTTKDTLAWWKEHDAARPADHKLKGQLASGLSPKKETAILEAWAKAQSEKK